MCWSDCRIGREILTIMITAYASIETAVHAIKRGATTFSPSRSRPTSCATRSKTAVRLVLARQARKLADERNEVRLQFMRMLRHELQAPLNAVDGYLELIQQRAKAGELESLDALVDRGQHRLRGMRELIRNLLDMTRIESGRRNERSSTSTCGRSREPRSIRSPRMHGTTTCNSRSMATRRSRSTATAPS